MRIPSATIIFMTLTIMTAGMAHAELLKAVRSGEMCTSADALAKLTLPDGSSRSDKPGASPDIKRIAKSGDCVQIFEGTVVVATQVRKNTIIIRYNPRDEAGTRSFFVPNIDFVPFTPPDTPFLHEIRQRCPNKLEDIYLKDDPSLLDLQDTFVATLPKSTQSRISAGANGKCDVGWRCLYHALDDELEQLNLESRWADYLCSQSP
jgi:hypothetical protein